MKAFPETTKDLRTIGENLKSLRLSKGFSQRELARRAGLTHTTISAIENWRIDPSLGTIKRILDACNVRMGDFFGQNSEYRIIRKKEQIHTFSSNGVHMRYLAPNFKGRLLEITQEIYDIGADTGPETLSHEGQEGGLVIRGTFKLTLGNEKFILQEGDSYYFSSTIPHSFKNIGDVEGEIINAASPPTF